MKSTVSLLTAGLALGVGFALSSPSHAGESVYSVNIVGFQQVDMPEGSQRILMAAPFSEDGQTLLDIFGSESLIEGFPAADADRIQFWNFSEQKYVSAAPFGGVFYDLDENGQFLATENTNEVNSGIGFWLTAPSGAPANRNITMAGDVSLIEEASIPIGAGLQILTYPFPVEVALQDLAFAQSGATGGFPASDADRIQLWNRELSVYESYGLFDGEWYRLDSAGQFVIPVEPLEYVLQPYEAFWYRALNSFTWVEDNPYLSGLAD